MPNKLKFQITTPERIVYSDEIDEREKNSLKEFKKEFGKKIKDILIITKNLEKEDDGIKYTPLWKWLILAE